MVDSDVPSGRDDGAADASDNVRLEVAAEEWPPKSMADRAAVAS